MPTDDHAEYLKRQIAAVARDERREERDEQIKNGDLPRREEATRTNTALRAELAKLRARRPDEFPADVYDKVEAKLDAEIKREIAGEWVQPEPGVFDVGAFNQAIHKLGEIILRHDLLDALANAPKLEPDPKIVELVTAAFEVAATPTERAAVMLQIIRRSMVRGFAIAEAHAEPDQRDGDLVIDWTAARAALDGALR